MTAQFRWKRRQLRGIEKRAGELVDPLERLRFVRDQMDLEASPRESGGWLPKRFAAILRPATQAVQLICGYMRRHNDERR